MKKLLLALYTILICVPGYASCPDGYGDLQSLRERIRDIRVLVRDNKFKELSEYMQFPLLGSGPDRDDRPIKIKKNVYLKYYEEFFVKDDSGNVVGFRENFLRNFLNGKRSYDELGGVGNQDSLFLNGCERKNGSSAGSGDLIFIWTKDNQWKISEIFLFEYGGNVEALKRRKLLEYWPRTKK